MFYDTKSSINRSVFTCEMRFKSYCKGNNSVSPFMLWRATHFSNIRVSFEFLGHQRTWKSLEILQSPTSSKIVRHIRIWRENAHAIMNWCLCWLDQIRKIDWNPRWVKWSHLTNCCIACPQIGSFKKNVALLTHFILMKIRINLHKKDVKYAWNTLYKDYTLRIIH